MIPFLFTPHVILALKRRGITEEEVAAVVRDSDQRIIVRPDRWVLQSRITKADSSRIYLLRVFVDTNRIPWEVVTAYITSKIDKYWS